MPECVPLPVPDSSACLVPDSWLLIPDSRFPEWGYFFSTKPITKIASSSPTFVWVPVISIT